MTTIIGIQAREGVHLFADTQMTDGDNRQIHLGKDTCKVFEVGDFMFGTVGSVKVWSILRYKFNPSFNQYAIPDIDFMSTVFTAQLSHAMSDTPEFANSSIMVAYNGKLYITGGDGFVYSPACGYSAIGAGSHYAIGALSAFEDIGVLFDNAHKYGKKSMRIACDNDIFSMMPCVHLFQGVRHESKG